MARFQRFWSIEYGDFLVTSIGRPRFLVKVIALFFVMFESWTGASICRSGARVPTPTSNRIWSLFLLVHLCATVVALCRWVVSTSVVTIVGWDSADISGYCSM